MKFDVITHFVILLCLALPMPPVSGQGLPPNRGMHQAYLSPPLLDCLQKAAEDAPLHLVVQAADSLAFAAYLHENLPGVATRRLTPDAAFFELFAVSQKQLFQLLAAGSISAAELHRRPFPEIAVPGLDLSLNRANLARRFFPKIDGSGMALSLKENAFDTADVDFQGRILPSALSAPASDLHASYMATIAAGGGNSAPAGRGVAPGAWLSASDFSNLLPDSQSYFTQNDLFVQNHSYGTGIENYYGMETAAYDQQCQSLPQVLHVFSAGNAGNQAPVSGTYAGLPGFANLTGQFKQSKNTLSVGAADSLGNAVPLSSAGPAYDGRIKPELIAYGQGGSSGAAALVSGIALLVQQVFFEKKGELPPAALVKAVLVNSAKDAGTPHLDFKCGFGVADAFAAVSTVLHDRTSSGKLEHGGLGVYQLTVQPGISQLKITLAWNDPPAPVGAAPALVNDLDLECRHLASGQTWLPWALSIFPHADSLHRPAIRARDSLNNIEQVTLANPPPGDYYIRVFAKRVDSGEQPFSLAWQMDSAGIFRWNFPTTTDYVLPEKQTILRWEHTYPGLTGEVQFRYVDGSEWETLAGNQDAQPGHRYWTPPARQGLAQLRWVSAGGIFLSDTFAVAEPLRPKVGFDCPDSLMFFWKKIPTAAGYQVFHLKNRYLEPLAATTDTLFVVDAAGKTVRHYAVAPLFWGKTGPLSYGFDYTRQGVGCFLKTFYLQLVEGKTVTFGAGLGTLYGLQSVVLEKMLNGVFQPTQVVQPVESLSLTLKDVALEQGVNLFRLKVLQTNGSVSYSQTETVYCAGDREFLLFPNPVSPGESFTLLSREDREATLRVLDVQGRFIFETDFDGTFAQIPVVGLPAGCYVLRILDGNGGQVECLRFLITSGF
jgi:hypothetical protein